MYAYFSRVPYVQVSVSDIFNEVTLELKTEERFKENILQTLKWSKYIYSTEKHER